MTALLEAADLRAGYGRAEVLKSIQLQIRSASVVTVIGPNGAGKSTLLNALMGMLPMRGSLRFDGEELCGKSLDHRVMCGIALVPEKRELFTTMSVADNLLLGGWRPKRLGDRGWRSALDQVYALFPRLLEREDQMAGTLSGGERQMLAIGRALMSQPRLLMLDEPSLGLAPLIVQEIVAIVDRLRATGVTVLLVEQNARAALRVADHAYVLESGEVMLDGPAAELANDPRVIDAYLGAHVDTAAA
jgi:branched-chain amino acid transport system ATP-binding protein